MLTVLASTVLAAGNIMDMDPGFESGKKCWRPMVKEDLHPIFSPDAGINGSGAAIISSPDEEVSSGFFLNGFIPVIGGHKYTDYRNKAYDGAAQS